MGFITTPIACLTAPIINIFPFPGSGAAKYDAFLIADNEDSVFVDELLHRVEVEWRMSVFLPKRNQLAGLTNHDNAIRMITHELVVTARELARVVTLHCTRVSRVVTLHCTRVGKGGHASLHSSWQGGSCFTARELVGVVTLHCM